MSAPQTASERAAWVRTRAKARGMTPQVYAECVAALRKDCRSMTGPGKRIVSAMGYGNVAAPEEIRADADARLVRLLKLEAEAV